MPARTLTTMEQAAQYLLDHPAARVGDVAVLFGFEGKYFSTKFKSEMAWSPKDYRELHGKDRVTLAMDLIANTDKSLEEIANEVGYKGGKALKGAFSRQSLVLTQLCENTGSALKKRERPRQEKDPETLKNIERIKELLRTTRMTMNEIHAEVGWCKTPRSMNARFHQEAGLSFKVYRKITWAEHGEPPERPKLRNLRVEMAKEFLRTTNWSHKKVAQRAGYLSYKTLYQAFYSAVGVAPSEYRQQEFNKVERLSNSRVQKALHLLGTTNLSVEEVGKKCGYGGGSQSRSLVLFMALRRSNLPSPQEYRMRFHLTAIKRELEQPVVDIKSVRQEYGFHMESGMHFSKIFKKLTGVRPKEWAEVAPVRRVVGDVVGGVVAHKAVAQEMLVPGV